MPEQLNIVTEKRVVVNNYCQISSTQGLLLVYLPVYLLSQMHGAEWVEKGRELSNVRSLSSGKYNDGFGSRLSQL